MSKTYKPTILLLEALWSDTREALEYAGAEVIESNPWDWSEVDEHLSSGKVDGLLLTGGSDINPGLYHEKPHPKVYGIDNLRDTVELYALDQARSLSIPVLGICRGSQIMCAARGGKLRQHIEGHTSTSHMAFAVPGARTFKRAIGGTSMECMSLHHQCVRRPGVGMKIAARAADGTPEAIESKDGLWLGVQFHPELAALKNPNAFSIFRWLVTTAARQRGAKAPRRTFKGMQAQEQRRIERYRAQRKAEKRAERRAKGQTREVASRSGGTELVRTRPPRKAGDPAVPSMRELTRIEEQAWGDEVIESTAEELNVCRWCGLLFDHEQDKMDHEYFLHTGGGYESDQVPFNNAEDRYPELMPPPGHAAWDDDA